MPPRRRANFPNAREAPVDEVYERDEIAQLRQQVNALTQQMAAMMRQHQEVPNSPSADGESTEEDNPFAPFILRSPDLRLMIHGDGSPVSRLTFLSSMVDCNRRSILIGLLL